MSYLIANSRINLDGGPEVAPAFPRVTHAHRDTVIGLSL